MEIHAINLLYFVISLPIILLTYPILSKLVKKDEKYNEFIIITLSILLFLVRFVLVFFKDTIGIMPYLVEDVVFYPLLVVFGLLITFYYLKMVERVSFVEIGWQSDNVMKSIGKGLLGFIPLIGMFPLMVFLTGIQVSFTFTWEKCLVGGCFAILAAFYEEFMFRGVIQNRFNKLVGEKKSIYLTALAFTLTHLFYLPFGGFGIYYIFVFVMALILSYLRYKVDQIACAVLHGGIVFILIILV